MCLLPGMKPESRFVQFAHVDHVHLAASQQRAELADLDRPERLELLRPVEVALELEQCPTARRRRAARSASAGDDACRTTALVAA